MIDEDEAGEHIVERIKDAMGEDYRHFVIEVDQLICEDDHIRFYLISFCPTEKALENLYCFPRDKNEVFIEFRVNLSSGNVSMFGQEKGYFELSAVNIYSALYWAQLYE